MAGYRRTRTAVVSDSGETNVIIGQEGVKVPSGDAKLTAGEVEKLTGTSKDTLRYYDREGLLCPARTGEGVSNNRKLYGPDDLDRLQAIQTLRAYNFSLEEIRRILDDESVDIYEVMAEKLEELERQEARLRALILFAQFVDLTNSDLIEGLANGPADLDALADLARTQTTYEDALQKFDAMSDEEAIAMLAPLDEIAEELMLLDEVEGFAGTVQLLDDFFAWWDQYVVPIEEVGYLGFWAIFEDHSLICGYIEAIGEAGDASTVQMCTFFAMLVRLVRETEALIAEISHLADNDIVAAIDEAHDLVEACAFTMIGAEGIASLSEEKLADLAFCVLVYLARIINNDELAAYLGVADELSIDMEDLEKALRVVDVMGSED